MITARFSLLYEAIRRNAVSDRECGNGGTAEPCLIVHPAKKMVILVDMGDPLEIQRVIAAHETDDIIHIFSTTQKLSTLFKSKELPILARNERWHPILLDERDQATALFCWFWDNLRLTQTLGNDVVMRLPRRVALSLMRSRTKFLHAFQQEKDRLEQALRLRYGESRIAPGTICRSEGRRLLVLVPTYHGSQYQKYCARDMVECLHYAGAIARLCYLDDDSQGKDVLLRQLYLFDPDVLLLNGQGRHNFAWLPQCLPIWSWDQDYLLVHNQDYFKCRQPHDTLFVMLKEWALVAATVAAEVPAHHLNMGVNTRIYHPPQRPIAAPSYDVLFIGNYFPLAQYKELISYHHLPMEQRQLFDRALAGFDAWWDKADNDRRWLLPDCLLLLRDCAADLDFALQDEQHLVRLMYYFRYRVLHQHLRKKVVQSLTSYRLGLFGGGWDADQQLRHFANPSIVNGREQLELIHASAIVLHFHSWTVHHPRLYDSAASGGFLMVGRVQEEIPIEQVFSPGNEVETFGSVVELREKIDYFLNNPQLRQDIAERGAMRARLFHSMDDRMGEVLALTGCAFSFELNNGLPQATGII